MNISLSRQDILNHVDTRVIVYRDLSNYSTIDEAMLNNKLVILYETRDHYGHWTCLFKYKNPSTKRYIISFFDSYGLMPDSELTFIKENFRKASNQYLPHLTFLLINAPYKVEYNEYQFQEKRAGIATCGRFVITRLIAADNGIVDVYEFKDLMLKMREKLRKTKNNPTLTFDNVVVELFLH